MVGLSELLSSARSRFDFLNGFKSRHVFYGILGVTVAKSAFELYLQYRQRRTVLKLETKHDLGADDLIQSIFTDDQFQKCRSYELKKINFKMIRTLLFAAQDTIFLMSNALPWMWGVSGSLLSKIGLSGELPQTAVFVLVSGLYYTLISVPFEYYYDFVIEQEFNFNKQTKAFFVKDVMKKFAVNQLMSLFLNVSLVKIISSTGDLFFFYSWAFVSASTLAIVFIYPDFIAPIFDRYSLLEDCRLKTAIGELTETVNFPEYRICIVDGSTRSSHSNAYLSGIFKTRRIVLFDTLVAQHLPSNEAFGTNSGQKCTMDEVLAVLGHELGHWHHMHMFRMMGILKATFFAQLFAYTMLCDKNVFFRALNFNDSEPIIIGLQIIWSYVLAPLNQVNRLAMTWVSRIHEFEADKFSAVNLKQAKHLINALKKLDVDNLGFPINDSLYSAYYLSHPSLVSRIKAIDKDTKKD